MRLKNKDSVTKTITTLYGDIHFSRTQLVPVDKENLEKLLSLTGSKSVYPLDYYLHIDNLPFKITAKMMVAIAKEAVRAASYERASESILQHYGVKVGDDTVRKVTDFVGTLVFQDDQFRAGKAMENNAIPIDKRKKHKKKSDILYIEMDGAMVNTRIQVDGTSWKECKIAIAFLSEDLKSWTTKNGDIRRQILDKRLIGYIGNCHDFKSYVLALAERYDYRVRNQIVVVSDGADWIQRLVKDAFPDAVHILDLSHLKEHIGTFGHFIHNDEEKARLWIDEMIELVEESKIEEITSILKPYEKMKCPTNVLNLYTYISNHRTCIDYKTYRKKGYFVGSGASESANKYTMQNRMKLQGMRWKTNTAQTMLSLKSRLESDCWKEVEQLVQDHCRSGSE